VAVLEIDDVQQQVQEAIRTGQNAVIDVVKTVADKLPSLPELPGSDRLPAPGEVVDKAFGFAEQVIDNQRDFAKKLVDALKLDGQPASKPKATKAASV
jgi:hypothetical protein